MTDKEIIKALECCSKDDKEICAKECPIFRTAGCVESLVSNALDLIKRQQAVINNLKNDCSVVEVNLEEAFLKECECEIEKAKETTTAKHRVGDRVRVRYDLSVGDYGNVFCNDNMVSQAGKILTIAKEPDSFGRYRVKECGYIWNDLMFEDELVKGDTPWLL